VNNRGDILVREDHPAFPGHFPGFPLYPGAAMLADVIAWLEANCGGAVLGVPRLKFLAPVLPGDLCEIDVEVRGDSVKVVCAVRGTVVLRGELHTGAPDWPVGTERQAGE
jgi:3-hydroxyacyl-[acyl-carrier-protein] dehydratase